MRLGPSFADELQAKEKATGLKLLVPGVSWGDPEHANGGLDPLPPDLTPEQLSAIQEVMAAHDPTRPAPKSPREQDRDTLDAALARVPPGPIADALAALRKLIQ